MSSLQKKVMTRIYGAAGGKPENLPWHRDQPPELLARAVRPGMRCLDVGCGSGVFSSYMAARGAAVTAIDYLPAAIEMARMLATDRGATFDVVHTDLFSYQPDQPFDLVLDSGCMHNMGAKEVTAYRHRLSLWLKPGGDFILGHWGKRHAADWRPIGPRRRTQATLDRLLPPELALRDVEVEDQQVPLPFGPRVRMACYWYRRRAA